MEQEEDGGGGCGLCRETGRCADLKYITAVPASAGLAVGTVRYLRHTQKRAGARGAVPQEEQEAFENAVREAQDQLIRLERRAAAQDRDIFYGAEGAAGGRGPSAGGGVLYPGGRGCGGIGGARGGHFAGRIRALEDPYMRERACDILDACRRVVKVLDGQPHETLRLTGPAILVAEELYPRISSRWTAVWCWGLSPARVPYAHAAIIARTMGIPAAVMAGPELLEGCDGRTLALNGTPAKRIWIRMRRRKHAFAHKLRLQRRHTLSQERLRAAPCTTRTARASR